MLDEDSTGTLWVAYTDDNGGGGRRVVVTHSTSDTRHFTAPAPLGVDGSEDLSDDDVVAIAAYGDRVGLLWSNQTRGSFVFASRPAGSTTTDWVGQLALQGTYLSDDHLSLKSPHDGSKRLYALVKTSLNDERSAPDAPQMLLLTLGDDGAWHSYPVWTITDHVTRPLLLLAPARNAADGLRDGAVLQRRRRLREDVEHDRARLRPRPGRAVRPHAPGPRPEQPDLDQAAARARDGHRRGRIGRPHAHLRDRCRAASGGRAVNRALKEPSTA